MAPSQGSSQVQGGGAGGGDNDPQVTPQAAGQDQVQVGGVDDILDEIDGLLENNADEFVKSYVQKGGQ